MKENGKQKNDRIIKRFEAFMDDVILVYKKKLFSEVYPKIEKAKIALHIGNCDRCLRQKVESEIDSYNLKSSCDPIIINGIPYNELDNMILFNIERLRSNKIKKVDLIREEYIKTIEAE